VEVAEAAEVVQPPDLSLGADPGLVHPDQDLDPGADQHPEVQDKKQMEKTKTRLYKRKAFWGSNQQFPNNFSLILFTVFV